MYKYPKNFWKIFISLLGQRPDLPNFFWKNFSRGIDPPIRQPKYPLYKGGYGRGDPLPLLPPLPINIVPEGEPPKNVDNFICIY